QVVAPPELHAGDLLDDVDELVDGDQLAAADVERLVHVAAGEAQGPLDAVVDEHEAARLLAVAPDLDLVGAGQLGLGHPAADGRRVLLAASGPGAVGAVDVVVAGYVGGQAEVLVEVAAHAHAEPLLPAVAVLGLGGVGVGLAQGLHLGRPLVLGGVDAGR